jgi:fluoride ion exporter CrcB/FEX
VYIFVFRRRREVKRDESRGLRIGTGEKEADTRSSSTQSTVLSIRVVVTVVFVAIVVLLCCSIFMFPKHQQFSISLLFTPFGCLARWKIQKAYNKRLPGFPLGTFSCNLLSVALSGSIGSFLAGNPGPEESIVLTSMIGKYVKRFCSQSICIYIERSHSCFCYCYEAGFAGSLSTFAGYISEVLALIDPIIFKFDGIAYAIITGESVHYCYYLYQSNLS